jgi:hypothetical protein
VLAAGLELGNALSGLYASDFMRSMEDKEHEQILENRGCRKKWKRKQENRNVDWHYLRVYV